MVSLSFFPFYKNPKAPTHSKTISFPKFPNFISVSCKVVINPKIMSDNIPFEIQMEIIKWLPVKPLIQFRSVSKPWKSFIDSPEFIKGYGARHTQPHCRILRYDSCCFLDQAKYMCLADDDNNETFKVQQQEVAPFVLSPFLKQYIVTRAVGVCHGLLCFHGFHTVYKTWMFVIWNPCIGKSFGIALPSFDSLVFGFGVCPVNKDPTVVKISCALDNMPWSVEVFTLSSGVWNVIPSGNLPRQSIKLNNNSAQAVIDRFIYWGAREETSINDGESTANHMVVSFDLITKEFKVLNLPDSLTNDLIFDVSVSKLKGSLVVYGDIMAEEAVHCGVWVMEHDSSFRKLFTVGAHVSKILGFTKNGETIIETRNEEGRFSIYDPCSQQIKYFDISGGRDTSFMGFYKESLLLLDHSDFHIYSNYHN